MARPAQHEDGNARPDALKRLPTQGPVIWDWPLRLWHWLFAAGIAFSLYTGLKGDIGLMAWHQRSGLALLGLLVFRLGWGLWGGRYARWAYYWTTPARFVDHFRGRGGKSAHTSPGVALATVLIAATAMQVGTGLFATDDIFSEGPLYDHASAEFARAANWIHHRLHWLILGGVGVHLAAHAVYGLALRDRTPLAMFTGRKPNRDTLPPARSYWLRTVLTLALAFGVVVLVRNAERWL